jgi:hypothetical protein
MVSWGAEGEEKANGVLIVTRDPAVVTLGVAGVTPVLVDVGSEKRRGRPGHLLALGHGLELGRLRLAEGERGDEELGRRAIGPGRSEGEFILLFLFSKNPLCDESCKIYN